MEHMIFSKETMNLFVDVGSIIRSRHLEFLSLKKTIKNAQVLLLWIKRKM